MNTQNTQLHTQQRLTYELQRTSNICYKNSKDFKKIREREQQRFTLNKLIHFISITVQHSNIIIIHHTYKAV